jgi:phospholipid/cholesterol/gamma-HCH transport system permease protein
MNRPQNDPSAAADWFRLFRRVFATLGSAWRKRLGVIVDQWEKSAWMGMPIVVAAGFSVGVVTWFQIRDILATYGAAGNLPSLLAVAVVVQTGPILTGLICAARLGAGIAAEIATMNLTEEADALASMGVDVVETLLTPRVIAAFAALPALTVAMDLSAVAGAMTAESLWGDMGAQAFLSRSLDLLTLRRALPATLKTAVFGGLTAFVAGGIGLRCPREAEAVGRAALRGVVGSIFAVLVADMLMVPLIQWSTRLAFLSD